MDSDSATDSGHKIIMAVLAKPFLHGRRQLNLVFHGNPSCKLHIFVSQRAVFLEDFFCMLEHEFNPVLCNPFLLRRLFMIFSGHFND